MLIVVTILFGMVFHWSFCYFVVLFCQLISNSGTMLPSTCQIDVMTESKKRSRQVQKFDPELLTSSLVSYWMLTDTATNLYEKCGKTTMKGINSELKKMMRTDEE